MSILEQRRAPGTDDDVPEPERASTFSSRPRGGAAALTKLGMSVVLLVIGVVGAAAVAASGVSFTSAARGMWAKALGHELVGDALRAQTLVWELRLPRIALAIAAGAGLSVAGVVLQALLRNPLVSPFTLGISSAASFGASAALVLDGWSFGGGQAAVVGCAFAVAIGCATLVFGLASFRRTSPEALVLVGIAVTDLFAALTAAMQYLATDEQLAEIVRWTFGSVNGAKWGHAAVVGGVVAVSVPVLLWRASAFNAVAFAGDDAARSLGVNVTALRIGGGLVAVALAATVVSFTGVIGFVGLVGPHIARLIIGADHRYLIPFSAVAGAALLLAADTIGRSLFSPAVIPVGIVVSLLGAPLFLNLVLARRRFL